MCEARFVKKYKTLHCKYLKLNVGIIVKRRLTERDFADVKCQKFRKMCKMRHLQHCKYITKKIQVVAS